jgi:hypothetical protein
MGRQKPGKPRKPRPEETHEHGGFPVPPETAYGHPVDHRLLGLLMGAAFDRCLSCQDTSTTLLVEDPVTTTRLVELACIGVHQQFGGLPSSLTDDDAGGPTHPAFKRLARAGLDGNNDAMFEACRAMATDDRRGAANTALDLLVGQMTMQGLR